MIPAQSSGAAATSSRPSGTRYAYPSSTTQCSAYPPSTSQPVKVGATQRFSCPRRQNRHVPSVPPSQAIPTRSPIRNRLLPGPSSSTTPTTSCPGTTPGLRGSGHPRPDAGRCGTRHRRGPGYGPGRYRGAAPASPPSAADDHRSGQVAGSPRLSSRHTYALQHVIIFSGGGDVTVSHSGEAEQQEGSGHADQREQRPEDELSPRQVWNVSIR